MAITRPDRFLLAGVMGDPVMHSRSPKLHNYWLAKYGLAGAYVPLAITAGYLRAALRALPALGFSGCNLTIPHKEAALGLVDKVDPLARRIGAVNCVVVAADGSLEGQNHDAFGYIEAVLVSLIDGGAREIRLVNRTPARAKSLARELGGPIIALNWNEREAALGGAAMLINATNQGMVGEPALDLALDSLPVTALVSDIIYIPRETALLAAARKRGNPTVNGLGMLLHQARPAFHAWFGIMPEVTPELRATIEATT